MYNNNWINVIIIIYNDNNGNNYNKIICVGEVLIIRYKKAITQYL